MVIWSFLFLSSLDVFEYSCIVLFVHFYKFESIFDIDVTLLKFLLEELISSIIVLNKSIIWLDDGEFFDGRLTTVGCLPFPNSLTEQEVVRFHLTTERELRDAEISLSMIEIVVPSCILVIR